MKGGGADDAANVFLAEIALVWVKRAFLQTCVSTNLRNKKIFTVNAFCCKINVMKIMIIGAGFTGTQLAKKLINEKNEVTIIDNDEDVARHVESNLDCSVYVVDGNNLQNLEDAGIAKMDALVTLTENDEINMITCSLVDSVYPDLLKIARVRNYAYYVNTNSVKNKHKNKRQTGFEPFYQEAEKPRKGPNPYLKN